MPQFAHFGGGASGWRDEGGIGGRFCFRKLAGTVPALRIVLPTSLALSSR